MYATQHLEKDLTVLSQDILFLTDTLAAAFGPVESSSRKPAKQKYWYESDSSHFHVTTSDGRATQRFSILLLCLQPVKEIITEFEIRQPWTSPNHPSSLIKPSHQYTKSISAACKICSCFMKIWGFNASYSLYGNAADGLTYPHV